MIGCAFTNSRVHFKIPIGNKLMKTESPSTLKSFAPEQQQPDTEAAYSSVAAEQNQNDHTALPQRERVGIVGTSYVENMWYFAVPSSTLRSGKMVTKQIAGEPIVLGRGEDGQPFALRDICPHQAVPLSDGRFDGKHIECCFHGWKFDTQGVCESIPALCSNQKLNLCAIKARSFPCQDELGSVWVFIGDQVNNLPEVPRAPGLEGYSYSKTTTTLLLPNHVDYNVVALIDTAHVPIRPQRLVVAFESPPA